MLLNEATYPDADPIDGYGPGYFRIGDEVFEGAVLVLPTGVHAWEGFADTATILDAAGDIDVLFVGTGAEIAHLPPDFRTALEGANLGLEVMASASASRSYNVLLAEGRRVAAALLPVG